MGRQFAVAQSRCYPAEIPRMVRSPRASGRWHHEAHQILVPKRSTPADTQRGHAGIRNKKSYTLSIRSMLTLWILCQDRQQEYTQSLAQAFPRITIHSPLF